MSMATFSFQCPIGPPNRLFSIALRAFYFIRTLTKALTYHYINRTQRHLLVAIENNRCGSPISFKEGRKHIFDPMSHSNVKESQVHLQENQWLENNAQEAKRIRKQPTQRIGAEQEYTFLHATKIFQMSLARS